MAKSKKQFRCSGCNGSHRRKGQRYCLECHKLSMQVWRTVRKIKQFQRLVRKQALNPNMTGSKNPIRLSLMLVDVSALPAYQKQIPMNAAPHKLGIKVPSMDEVRV